MHRVFSPCWLVFWLTQKIISTRQLWLSLRQLPHPLLSPSTPSLSMYFIIGCCYYFHTVFCFFHQLLVAGCTSEVGIRCLNFIKTNGGRKPYKLNAVSVVGIYRLSRRKRAFGWKVADGVCSTINLLHSMIHEVISLFNNHVCSWVHTHAPLQKKFVWKLIAQVKHILCHVSSISYRLA